MARTPLLLRPASAVGNPRRLRAWRCFIETSSRRLWTLPDSSPNNRLPNDPARQPHPGDPNPLRRKLGDLQIRELFFGATQTQGDWIAYLPCSQDKFGLPVAGPNRIYLKRCAALERYLLDKAHGAGFADATARDVLDPRISHASNQGPRP